MNRDVIIRNGETPVAIRVGGSTKVKIPECFEGKYLKLVDRPEVGEYGPDQLRPFFEVVAEADISFLETYVMAKDSIDITEFSKGTLFYITPKE